MKSYVTTLFLLGSLGIAFTEGKAPLYPINGTLCRASDDGSSPVIPLRQCFNFFGRDYCQLYVNQNGHLTFESPYASYKPQRLPMHGPRDIIAIFWADLDNRKRGKVMYQQYTSGNVLEQATSDINEYYPNFQNKFEASWVFVATWYRVPYYPHFGAGSTVQVVIISDGHLSFVLMNYETVYPTINNVQTGFDTVNSTYHFSIHASFRPNVTNFDLCQSSNINVPGRWVFQVNQLDAVSKRVIPKGDCTIYGDPHYKTFDGRTFDFQGNCTYVLSQRCSSELPFYRVEGSNKHQRSRTVTWTHLVKVFVFNQTIELVKDHPGEAKVNGIFEVTPIVLFDGAVHVSTSGSSVVVTTVFGLEVYYDTRHYVTIKVPYSYQGATCGLCGNFNDDPNDDFHTADLRPESVVDFGKRWKVDCPEETGCGVGCETLDCNRCSDANVALFSSNEFCGILQNISGPFASCHQVIRPDNALETCVFDLCLEEQSQEVLCAALSTYARRCQENGVQLPSWRSADLCEIRCPENSHFVSQAPGCPATCVDPRPPLRCTAPSLEACVCDEGYVLSGARCVRPHECGCKFEGHYYHSGQTVILDQDCNRCCDCNSGEITCQPHGCEAHEECEVLDGVRGCRFKQSHGTCSGSGDPHYSSFDGRRFDFQGTCRYVLATLCNHTSPNYFSVEVKNEALPGLTVSITAEVFVNTSGFLIHLSKQHNGMVKVNGLWRNLSLSLHGVQVFVHGQDTIVLTDFGLYVSYDGQHRVKVEVPFNYSGTTCGLCGNFNGNPSDDFQTPSGQSVTSPSQFGTSWKVPGNSSCSDGCGSSCPQCPDDRAARAQCDIIRAAAGPFHLCHPAVNPEPYFNDCVFDVCIGGAQLLCSSIQNYASSCQSANIVIYPWRQNTSCDLVCPAHSHYDICANDCGRTCASNTNVTCGHACSEGCFCDPDFFRSGSKCVPDDKCGCQHNGVYYDAGESFWTEGCSQHCECSANNNVSCRNKTCSSQEQCSVLDGVLGCSEETVIQQKKGYCTVDGDPHYKTFDGRRFAFQGNCTYVLSQRCSSELPFYRVEGSNKHQRSRTVTWTNLVKVFVFNQTIELVKDHPGEAKVNGIFEVTPIVLFDGAVHVSTSGSSVVVTTVFGLEVYYDTRHYVTIKVPYSYQGATCGLCGNFNDDPNDDFHTADLRPESVVDFGKRWKVDSPEETGCGVGCETLDCNRCSDANVALFSSNEFCGILQNISGPFASCHQVIRPDNALETCVFDLCLEEQSQEVLCAALSTYARRCQENGVQLPSWRSADLCEIRCPENSHFVSQAPGCPATCVDPRPPLRCTAPSLEACVCDEGYVLSGARCVRPHECGCKFEGHYYHSGQTVILDQDCNRRCDCNSGEITCQPHGCEAHEECEVLDGVRGCRFKQSHGTCSGSGDPHYSSFDGRRFDFQGTCRYVLATLCNHTSPNYFSVEVKNEALPGLTVSITAEVFVNTSGFLIHLSKQHNGMVKVNGLWRNLSLSLHGVQVFVHGQDTIVLTDFGLYVSYDGQHRVKVEVPFNYSGTTCGLCGNFNGNPSDDFQTPSGQSVTSPSQFGTSWKVPGNSSCSDGCGSSCPQCPDDRAARAQCDIIRAAAGPFHLCHPAVNPEPYFNDCVFDVCIGGAQLLCSSIQNYASSCQSANIVIYPWRQNTSCDLVCPGHSHYDICANDCGRTCASNTNVTCGHACSEGCFCDPDFFRSGSKCVPDDKCGCQHNGVYYDAGESFWTEGCSQHCECSANNNVSCRNKTCSSQEQCSVLDGVLGCSEETGDPCREFQCTDEELCGVKNDINGCFCLEIDGHNSDNFDSSITCVSSSGTLSLSRCLLFEAGYDPSALHLREESCKGSLHGGRLEFHFDDDTHLCGTTLRSNRTHLIYENAVEGDDALNKLFFSCVFPFTYAVSMDIAINPVESAVKKILPAGQGHYRVRIIPYSDAGFQNPLGTTADVTMSQDEQLFIEVRAEGIDDQRLSVVMDSCWATPSEDAQDLLHHDLISQGCPADLSVTIIQNGVSTVAQFSFDIISLSDFSSIHVHCHTRLCLLQTSDCVTNCNVRNRVRRDVSYSDSILMSVGPLAP